MAMSPFEIRAGIFKIAKQIMAPRELAEVDRVVADLTPADHFEDRRPDRAVDFFVFR